MYEERENGTHAITCSNPGCKHEVIGVCKEDVYEDAGLEGWAHKDDNHMCPPCNRNPAKAMMNVVAPQSIATVAAPTPIQKGSPVYIDGQAVGVALDDAATGDPVEVQLNAMDEPPEEEQVNREQYADILDEEDDYDDEEDESPTEYAVQPAPVQPTAVQQQEADDIFGFLEEGGASKTAWEPD